MQSWLRQACQKFVVHVQTKIFANKFFGRLINFSSFPEIQQKFFRVLTTKFQQGGHNCCILVHRNIFRKVNFLSICSKFFFRGFWNLSRKSVDSQRKLFATVVKNAFSVAKESFLMKKKVCSKICNIKTFGVREYFSYFWGQSHAGLAKISLCMLDERFGEKFFFGRRTIFSSFPDLEQTVFRNLTRNFLTGWSQLDSAYPDEDFFLKEGTERKITFSKKIALLSFWDFERKRFCVILVAWLRQACQNFVTSLYMFRRTFWQTGFLESPSDFHNFWNSSKTFSKFWQEYFGRVVTIALYVYRGTFLGKLLSFRIVQIFFRSFRKLSRKSVNCQRKLFVTVVKIAFSVAKESFLMKKINLFKKM